MPVGQDRLGAGEQDSAGEAQDRRSGHGGRDAVADGEQGGAGR